MEISAYLERMKYDKPVNPDVKTLYGLHLAHMLAVPFENLDIGIKRKIHITEQGIYEKVVINNRGGFCYELNGLFAWLLKQIGFEVTYLNAQVYGQDGKLGINFDHLALLVQIPGQPERWLADVGFGDSFTELLKFVIGVEQPQGLRAYRVDTVDNGHVVWQRNYDGIWERLYFFDLQPHIFPNEYEAACLYHQTSPNSSFTRGNIISRATPDGRVSLEDGWLIITINGNREKRPLVDEAEYKKLLKEYFDVEL